MLKLVCWWRRLCGNVCVWSTLVCFDLIMSFGGVLFWFCIVVLGACRFDADCVVLGFG